MNDLDGIKAWALGLIVGPMLGLLLWYFKRSMSQYDKKLDDLDEDLDEVRGMLANKLERTEMRPIWEKFALQERDIKNLGDTLSAVMRQEIDTLRRENIEGTRQTNERLDRILLLIAKGNSNEH